MSDANHNHIGDLNEMVDIFVGDNKSLREDLQAMLEAHDEMMVLIEQLYTQRDEARREVCVLLHTDENGCVRVGKSSEAAVRGWDCFETPKEKDPVEVRQRWEAYRLRKEQEAQEIAKKYEEKNHERI